MAGVRTECFRESPKVAFAENARSVMVLIKMAEKLARVVLPGAAAGLCGQLLRRNKDGKGH